MEYFNQILHYGVRAQGWARAHINVRAHINARIPRL